MVVISDNTEGKLNFDGVIYNLVGYYDYFDIRPICESSPFSIGNSFSRNVNRACMSSEGIYIHSPKVVAILMQFGLEPINCITVPSGRFTFVFMRAETADCSSIEEIDLFECSYITKKPIYAIRNFLKAHKKVPLLVNQDELLNRYLRENHKESVMDYDFFMDRVFPKFNSGYDKRLEYKEESERKATALELQEIQLEKERLDFQKLALRKGGHVKVSIQSLGKEHLVPKLPLIHLRSGLSTEILEEGLYTWFFEGNPGVFKSPLIRDLLMGSDIPTALILSHGDDIVSDLKNSS